MLLNWGVSVLIPRGPTHHEETREPFDTAQITCTEVMEDSAGEEAVLEL